MSRTIQFNGQNGHSYDIVETPDLLVVRTNDHVDPVKIFWTIPDLRRYLNNIVLHDKFSESAVFIYRVVGTHAPSPLREVIKNIIKNYNHPLIQYAGTVLCYGDSGIYQIYTGNIFIKFYDQLPERKVEKILQQNKFEVKMKMGFAKNAFFVNRVSEIGRDIFDMSMELLYHSEIEYCHPELVVRRKTVFHDIPVDSVSLQNTPQNWIFTKINLYEAWKYTKGRNVRICVIDDGLEFNHRAFSTPGKIPKYRDMLDKTRLKRPLHQYEEMHGTACAGIACSADPRVPGIAPMSQLIPIRTIGLGSVLESEAFYWAAQNGADIISCSWGPPDGDFTINPKKETVFPIPDHTNLAIHYAARKGRKGLGCMIFFAAGNGNEKVIADQYASHPAVMAIGATNFKDEKAIYGDYDSPLFCSFPSGDYVNDGKKWKQLYGVAVPDRIGASGYDPSDIYKLFSGTSASCPGMAGIAALLLSLKPTLSAKEAKNILSQSCRPLGNPRERNTLGYHPKFGYGLIQADQVIKNVLKQSLTSIKTNTMDNKNQNTKGYSLHIGINNVSDSYYGNNVPPLYGCINDMERMERLAQTLGYSATTLVDEQATRSGILEHIGTMKEQAQPGDIVMISYAGHGAPIPDEDKEDEDDGYDESWVTYDGFLIDDELNAAFTEFDEGVRILVVSDSCHSGTVTRMINFPTVKRNLNHSGIRLRFIDKTAVKRILERNSKSLRSIKPELSHKRSIVTRVKAPVKLMAACQDDQYAQERDGAGLFTSRMFEVLDKNGNNNLSYEKLMELVLEEMPSDQKPQIKDEGNTNVEFNEQVAFSISTSETIVGSEKTESPKKKTHRRSTIVLETNEDFISISPAASKRSFRGKSIDSVKVFDREVDGTDIVGDTDWDKAYNLFLSNQDKKIEFIEAYLPPEPVEESFSMGRKLETRSSDEFDWLKNYPPRRGLDEDVPFDWHLDNEHSELKAAREIVYPELITGEEFDRAKPNVRIAHIDTGMFHQHPTRPKNMKYELSVTVESDGIAGDAEDKDVRISLSEQQGHGNATLAILAGGRLNADVTGGEFSGYFGAIPLAEIISIKISETVALLSGNRLAQAIDYAIDMKVDVITMSMAGWPSKAMAKAVNRAYEAGIIICSAASNSWVKGFQKHLPDSMLYPARFDRTIGVVGAAYNQVPYVYELHNPKKRTAGGNFMQMSYGPDSVMHTAIAGYTPNVIWFDVDKKDVKNSLYFVKNGGGTSSATPQVAAAAALYIQFHRNEIDRIAGNEKWKKVEIVKSALFESAFLDEKYKKYYGNGILRAKTALSKKPSRYENKLEKAPEAKIEGSFFSKLFSIYKRRLIDNQPDDRILEMMGTELLQLMHREAELYPFLQHNFTDRNDKLSPEETELLVSVVQKSKLASTFLKNHIITYGLSDALSAPGSIKIESSNVNFIEFQSEKRTYNLRTSGLKYQVKKYQKNVYQELANNELAVDEIEIELNTSTSRGESFSMNLIANFDAAERQGIVLMERNVNGEPAYEWIFNKSASGKTDNSTRGSSLTAHAFTEETQFDIGLQSMISETNRGNILELAGKVILKIISWKKPREEKNSSLKEWLEKSADSNYKMVSYDLESDDTSGTNWLSIDKSDKKFTNIWKTIKEDQKPLLFLFPGLFREVQENYSGFLSNPSIVQSLKNKYCRYIIGFNMPDVVRGIKANAEKINDMLPADFINKECDAICRSRGGLVARYLFEKVWGTEKKTETTSTPFVLNKMLMIATPNEGTPIAGNEKWKDLVNLVANILGKAFVIGSPIFKGVQTLVAAIVNHITNLDGINDLEVKSGLLKELNDKLGLKENYYIIASDYEPKNGILRFLEEIAVDRYVFSGITNDGVVPVKSVVFSGDYKTQIIPEKNRFLMGASERVHHFHYLDLKNDSAINWTIMNFINKSTKVTEPAF